MAIIAPLLGAFIVTGVAAASSAIAQGVTWDLRRGWRLPPLARPSPQDGRPRTPV